MREFQWRPRLKTLYALVLCLVGSLDVGAQDFAVELKTGSVGEITALLESGKLGANNNWYVEYGHFQVSPLALSAAENSVGVVEVLLEHGANPNSRDSEGATPFLLAAGRTRDVEVLRLLVARGANPLERDYLNFSALHYAAASGTSTEVIRFLLGLGLSTATRTNQNYTPAMLAVSWNASQVTKEIVGLLVDNRTRLLDRNDLGESVFELACSFVADTRVLAVLISLGADPNRVWGYYNMSPLMCAAAYNSNPEVIDYLISVGANAAYVTAAGESALSLAAGNPMLAGTDVEGRLKL